MQPLSILNEKQARAEGYRALTRFYTLPDEQGMLENVMADMQRGQIDSVLVFVAEGVEVWRKGHKNPQ
jgi:hypothetical protein